MLFVRKKNLSTARYLTLTDTANSRNQSQTAAKLTYKKAAFCLFSKNFTKKYVHRKKNIKSEIAAFGLKNGGMGNNQAELFGNMGNIGNLVKKIVI
jgi:hypothetical protein